MDLRLEGISHNYGSLKVLEGINLAIEHGKILCVVGPSGCGKSTLLRLIGGLERPSAGQVMQIGEAPSDSLNPLTYIFQDFALLPWRTVAGNINLVLEDQKLSRQRRRDVVENVLQRTKLSDFADALPRQLSGGMKQRVAIARALAVSPAVFLMDEPLSALDSQTRELLIEDLVDLWTREPFTAVYVTHNLAEAVRLGHSVAVFSRRPGQIREVVKIGTPLADRKVTDPELIDRQDYLWRLMKDEALAADLELSDA